MTRRAVDPRSRGTSAWVTAVRERTFGNVTEKLLMMILCDYINGDDEAWPGNDTLAPDVGVDPRTVKRTLARLEEAGVIRRYRRPRRDGRGRCADVIVFLWPGFLRLPLVSGDHDQGDTLSNDQGDNGEVTKGTTASPSRGHLEPLSSFRTPSEEPPQKNPVDLVFQAWLTSTKKTARTVLDTKRRRLIENALRSHPLTDVLDAVRGWEHSPYHRGENPEHKVWNDLGLLLRDAEHIEKFRDLARGPWLKPQPAPSRSNGYRPPIIDTDRSGPSRVLTEDDL